MIKPFKVNIKKQDLDKIYKKVKLYPWHEMPKNGGWLYGTNIDFMKKISKYWINSFDWKKYEANLE